MRKDLKEKIEKVLQVISEHGYITIPIFGEIVGSQPSGYRYVKILQEEYKYIEAFETYVSGKAFSLTRRGWERLENVGKARVLKNFPKSDYNPTLFYHTIFGVEVRLIFEQHPWVVDYRPSRVLKYFAALKSGGSGAVKGKQCDAEIVVQTPEKKYLFGVEIELTQKSNERVAKVFRNISAHRDDLDKFLWLCSTPTVMKHLRDVYKREREKKNVTSRPEHFFVLLDEFKTKKFHAEWVDVENRKTAILPSLEMLVGTTQQQEKPVPVGPVEPAKEKEVVQPIPEHKPLEDRFEDPISGWAGEIQILQRQPRRR